MLSLSGDVNAETLTNLSARKAIVPMPLERVQYCRDYGTFLIAAIPAVQD